MKRGVIVLLCLLGSLVSVAPASAGPLRTAVVDPENFSGPGQELAFRRTKATGASMVRLLLPWSSVAPGSRSETFAPENPRDLGYRWAAIDNQVEEAVRAGLEPILVIQYAPTWAEGPGEGVAGTVNVDPVQFGRFARAAAERYSGKFDINKDDPYAEPHLLPRVRYWQAWNEPNRDYFFKPQYEGGRMVSPAAYRAMVNRFAEAVHAADPTNYVIAGGLAPIGRPGKPAPLAFMRAFLAAPVEFDIWSHHPYTSGGPLHGAAARDDVSLGDLPQMRSVLHSAVRTGRVQASRSVGFWVTEFSWDSSPPDPRGVRASLHARWVSEALYRMWKNGVTLVTWFRIQDDPLSLSPYQSGFYRTNGARKSSLTAFRFPVVAFRGRRGITVWGRTPTSKTGTVVIELTWGRGWRRLGTLRANSYGIFQRTYRTPFRKGYVRARYTHERSLAFSLTPVPDRYVNPFGCGGPISC